MTYVVSKNDVSSSVVRLTQVQDYIPETAYINEGQAPDPYDPPKSKAPIRISWGGQESLHFVSAPHGHAPKPRNEAVDDFFARFAVTSGTELIIEVPRAGQISIRKK